MASSRLKGQISKLRPLLPRWCLSLELYPLLPKQKTEWVHLSILFNLFFERIPSILLFMSRDYITYARLSDASLIHWWLDFFSFSLILLGSKRHFCRWIWVGCNVILIGRSWPVIPITLSTFGPVTSLFLRCTEQLPFICCLQFQSAFIIFYYLSIHLSTWTERDFLI